MLVSSRLSSRAVSSSPMTLYENPTNRNHSTNSSTLIPPASLPKHFNVPFAIQHGHFRCIRYLLQLHHDPNERDSQLRTPLILCAYVENDRWSLSLAQNLLEKGAKIALEDHARRNAMHHACALQRLHLVRLYLSCLDYNIEAKDCEGNTCLHYAAITGNCEIAELLIRSAEKLGVRLDQYVNREGCSAAILALKYGHIECANQISHRDCDEFFVVPRPLSIYETPPTTDDNQTTVTATTTTTNTTTASDLEPKKQKKTTSRHASSKKNELRSLAFSFGLLKIIFNDSDTGYSTRLAGLCKQEKRIRLDQMCPHKQEEASKASPTAINKHDRVKSTTVNGRHSSSTEALVNQRQSARRTADCQTSLDSHGNSKQSNRSSPRTHLLMQQQQQQLFNKSTSKETSSSFIQSTMSKTQLTIDHINHSSFQNDSDAIRSKLSIPTIYRQTSNSTLNQSDTKSHRATTAMTRPKQLLPNPPEARSNSVKIKPSRIPTGLPKQRLLFNERIQSINDAPKPRHSTVGSETTAYSRTIYSGQPVSIITNHSVPRSNPSACSIHEVKGAASRYSKPEELFGVRPEELFNAEQHQPKILDHRTRTKDNENTRLKRHQFQKQHIWQQDVDKIIQLYNIHHCANYRKSAKPPLPAPPLLLPSHTSTQVETLNESSSLGGRTRRGSIARTPGTSSKQTSNLKQSTFTTLNIPRRNSISRPSIKLTNT